ncbi:MAG: hypothetical protein ACE5GJ_10045 [Gemmatimonadota bacterium]
MAEQTCGVCHAREVARVARAPMATLRGLIAVDLWAFGEQEFPDGEETVEAILNDEYPTLARDHLRRLCLGCHLRTRRGNRDDAIPPDAGSGCGACHTAARPAGGEEGHSDVIGVPDDGRCFGCHSRSGRISLTDQGLAEVSGPWAEACRDRSSLADGRGVCRIPADVHQEAGMGCVDCHLHTELMGDSASYAHQEEAVEITCELCHGPVPYGAERTWFDVWDPVTQALLRLRNASRFDTEAVRVTKRGTPVWNLRPGRGASAGTWVLERKRDPGVVLPVTPTPEDVTHRVWGHERVSCAACHAAAAPTCPTCHTSFDATGEQWDFGAGGMRPGMWVETSRGVGFAPPRMAVGGDGRIRPAIPGMTAELDARAAGGPRRHVQLFSVLDPHNTRRAARECASCHGDPGVFMEGSGTRRGARSLTAPARGSRRG